MVKFGVIKRNNGANFRQKKTYLWLNRFFALVLKKAFITMHFQIKVINPSKNNKFFDGFFAQGLNLMQFGHSI